MSHMNNEGLLVKSFTHLSNGVMLYPITNNLVDVFVGRGFKNGARMRKTAGKWVTVRSWGIIPKNFSIDLPLV